MMFGGLKKSASRLALVAAAGVLSTNAFAADLGGDCCADLEERVAELEATTARKGTRKTSLEVWGQVNKIIVAWNDGINKNVTLGTDNTSASTRFGFRGMAKVHPGLTAGYSIVIEQATGGSSVNVSQFQDKGGLSAVTNAPNSSASVNGIYFNQGANDALVTMREANWWLESSTVGRLTVGRFVNTAGVTGQIDLAGIGLTAASGSASIIGTGLTFRTNIATGPATTAASGIRGSANYTNYTLGNTTDNKAEYATRENGVMWTSPTLAGFTLAASVANTLNADTQCNPGSTAGVNTALTGCAENFGQGPIASVNLKYAGEAGGFRYAAAIGYEDSNNANATSMFGNNGTSLRQHSTNAGVSGSLMHVPTGLFAQGFYNQYTRGHDLFSATGGASVYSLAGITKDRATQWMLQGGIVKNWFGLGNTALYGEYQVTNNGFNTIGLETFSNVLFNGVNGTSSASNNPANPNPTGGAYTGDVTRNRMFGLGVVQDVDAAAMKLYAGYRSYSLTSDNCTLAGGCKDISVFVTGAKINF